MSYSDFVVPVVLHRYESANEGLFTDSKRTAAEKPMGAWYSWYGDKARGFVYPNDKFVSGFSDEWQYCPADFNKNGVNILTKLVAQIKEGYKFAQENNGKVYELMQAGREEEARDLIDKFAKIFSAFGAMNRSANNGNKVFGSGEPVEVTDSAKKATMKLAADMIPIMKDCARIVKDGSMKDVTNKSAINKLLHGKDNEKTAYKRNLYYEVYQYCYDFLIYLGEAKA